jgi:hypothetical protein
VIDITRRIVLTIIDDDRDAFQCDPWECVIANALNRRPGVSGAQVGAEWVRFIEDGVTKRGYLPRNMRMMIKAYDKDNQIMPSGIQIEIIPPRPSERLGRIKPTSTVPEALRKRGKPSRFRKHAPSSRNIYVKPHHDGESTE